MTEPLKLLSLFAGIGGFELGLERSGLCKTVAQVEIDPYCQKVLAKHWPEVKRYDDVRTLTAEQLAADGIAVDAICGGFPCQDISTAGKGAGIEGERSGLWREYARLIGELRPRYVFVENVSALISGKDVYEYPNDRCLCGWPYRWGGLHQRGSSSSKVVLPQSGRGHDTEGQAPSGEIAGDVWRHRHDDQKSIGKVGRGVDMATIRVAFEGVFEGNLSASDFEAGASSLCVEASGFDQLTAEEAEWHRFVDFGGDQCSESDPMYDDGTKCKGTDADGNGGRVCPSCGRHMDNAPTRSGIATWMGRVLGDLAALGYDAEWHCIRACRFGLPHNRDRLWVIAHTRKERAEGGITEALRGFKALSRSENVREAEKWARRPNLFEAGLCRNYHGFPGGVDRVGALGNAVVPQIPELLGRAVLEWEGSQ